MQVQSISPRSLHLYRSRDTILDADRNRAAGNMIPASGNISKAGNAVNKFGAGKALEVNESYLIGLERSNLIGVDQSLIAMDKGNYLTSPLTYFGLIEGIFRTGSTSNPLPVSLEQVKSTYAES